MGILKNKKSKPFKSYVIQIQNILNKKDLRTTLMIKNIPNKCDHQKLLNMIDENY